MKRCVPVIFALFFSLAPSGAVWCEANSPHGAAPLDSSTYRTATLTVHSNVPNVRVYEDSLLLGIAPIDTLPVGRGRHVLYYIDPRGASWFYPSMVETLEILQTEQVRRTITFPVFYHITSEPYGATVRYNDSIVGQTPLNLTLLSTKGLVTLSKPGFDDITVPVTPDNSEVHVLLRSRGDDLANQTSFYLSHEQSKNPVPIYITTGATVLTGAAAAYFKIKADNSYDDYRHTGDPGNLDQVHRFDIAAGISLAASEVALFTLSYFLLSR